MKFVIFSLTLIEPIFESIRGYTKIREPAWFLHPLMCLLMVFGYGWSEVCRKYRILNTISMNIFSRISVFYDNGFYYPNLFLSVIFISLCFIVGIIYGFIIFLKTSISDDLREVLRLRRTALETKN